MMINASPQISPANALNDYNDLGALQAVKYAAAGSEEARLDAVAKQFESIFVSLMIKSMRDANKGFSEGNMLQSSQTDMYQQMFDSQLAVTLANSKGLGLAEVIKRQLSKEQVPQAGSEDGFAINRSYSIADYERKHFAARLKPEDIENTVSTVEHLIKTIPSQGTEESPYEPVVDFSSPEKFVESLYPLAKRVEAQTGIDARLMLAQSALETGWGQHQIAHGDGSATHNLFGIKAQAGWAGDKAEITTTEYRGGVAMKERANFRAYDSYEASFADYANFLKSNPRYEDVFNYLDDPKAFAQSLQESGYATDPQYAAKISRIIERYLSQDELSGVQAASL